MPTAIVTGGSRGFGHALVEVLVGAGWTVVVDGRSAGPLAELARKLGPAVQAVPGDVTSPDHRHALVNAAGADLSLIVNNAGALGPSPLPRLAVLDLGALEELYRTNVAAPLGLVQAGLAVLRNNQGAVINVTSDAAVEAYEGWGAYGSSKAALDQVTRVLAEEEPGVRFWSFDPGDMRTDMHQAAFPGEDISDRPLPGSVAPAVLALLKRRLPSGRVRAADLLAAVQA
ncbi:MAG TPA: SDR family NAD(P)-dependent oxidoreductase [Acidimicrobiales bacterium]|nr:SDR family NAD(P)-dependent oxidoreductase [Acidimicrobiales bacterium]